MASVQPASTSASGAASLRRWAGVPRVGRIRSSGGTTAERAIRIQERAGRDFMFLDLARPPTSGRSAWRMALPRLLALVVLAGLVTGPARAHALRVSTGEVTVDGRRVQDALQFARAELDALPPEQI